MEFPFLSKICLRKYLLNFGAKMYVPFPPCGAENWMLCFCCCWAHVFLLLLMFAFVVASKMFSSRVRFCRQPSQLLSSH
jgi:hypothetical protein